LFAVEDALSSSGVYSLAIALLLPCLVLNLIEGVPSVVNS